MEPGQEWPRVPYCADCKFLMKPSGPAGLVPLPWQCTHPWNVDGKNPVDGIPQLRWNALELRSSSGACGAPGSWFQPWPPVPERSLMDWLLGRNKIKRVGTIYRMAEYHPLRSSKR